MKNNTEIRIRSDSNSTLMSLYGHFNLLLSVESIFKNIPRDSKSSWGTRTVPKGIQRAAGELELSPKGFKEQLGN